MDGYFELLKDTLLGFPLPAYRPGLKVREAALETLIFHELRVRNTTARLHRPLAYYRTAAGAEIDFIIETRKRQPGLKAHVVCIEVKHAERWQRKWERPLRDMAADGRIETARMIGVYRGDRRYRFDGLDVLPVRDFLDELHGGRIF